MMIFETTILEIRPKNHIFHGDSEDSPMGWQECQRRLGQWSQHLGGLRVTGALVAKEAAPRKSWDSSCGFYIYKVYNSNNYGF
jgi:hypothetical protein